MNIPKKIIFLPFVVICVAPLVSHAATLKVVASSSSVVVGQSFQVNVALDTKGEDANAIQGEVTFPPGFFIFKGINDGASPVSLWIEPPHEISSGTVEFSGIIPGGFTGSASSVVGVLLAPVTNGTGTIDLQNVQLLRNDGQGTAIAVTTAGQPIAVAIAANASPSVLVGPVPRFTVPEMFVPIVTTDPNIYDGKYFLVFSTTDKGSGINYYDVTEVPAGTAISEHSLWATATSPYLLKDQSLSSDIYIRAVNNAGIATIVKVPARFPPSIISRITSTSLSSVWLLLFLFLLVILAFYFLTRSRKKKRSHRV
jgi:hypothetical protein